MMFELKGQCPKCQAPVFLNECSDWYGNTFMSLNCWNGHYKWLEVQEIEEKLEIDPETNIVSYIGFFDLG